MDPKKKKLYAALLAFGFLALLLDRFVFSEPSSAAASPTRPATDSNTGPAQSSTAHGEDAVAVTPQAFPNGLIARPAVDLRDAFQLTPSVLKSMRLITAEDGPEGPRSGKQQAQRISADEFSASHKLEAVIHGASVNIAVLDGRWVNIGDVVDGWKLADITGRIAVFKNGENRAELMVSDTSD